MKDKKILGMMGMDIEKLNLSVAGCGYLGIYHVGVGACMRKFSPQIFKNKVSGASVGALVAAAFLCEVPLESCTMSVINVVLQVRHGILGPITPDLDIMTLLYDNMACILPEDAHLYCNGKLHISVTRYEDKKNVLLNQFESKEDLLQALMCSCFIPVYCGFDPPRFHGVAYVDGGYSNNCPVLDEHTVTVSPFCGQADICPKDKSGEFRSFMMNGTSVFLTLENCRRLIRVLFPGPPDMMKDLCQKGYNDALRYLRNNGLLDCPDCSSEINGNALKENNDHENCKPIEYPIPTIICDEIDAAVMRLQQGFGQRLLRNPIMKVLYYVNMPSIITAKVSYSLFSALARKLQLKTSSCLDNAKVVHGEVKSKKMECLNDSSNNLNHLNQALNTTEPTNIEIRSETPASLDSKINGHQKTTFDSNYSANLDRENSIKKEYNSCYDVFQITGDSPPDLSIDSTEMDMSDYFVVNQAADVPENTQNQREFCQNTNANRLAY